MKRGVWFHAVFLIRGDLHYMFRSRETWLWTFVMPLIFFYFLGTVTGGTSGRGNTRDIVAILAPPSEQKGGFLTDAVVRHLEERKFQVVRVRDSKQLAAYRRQLVVPEDFTKSVLEGKTASLQLTRNGGGPGADYDEFRVQLAAYATLADLIVISKDGAPVTPASMQELARRPRNIAVKVTSAGRIGVVPTGFQQAVPGTMVMFTLLILFTSGAVTLTLERNQGILRRLASAPMPRSSVLIGKCGARLALGLIQLSFAMLVGTFLFHVNWGPQLPAVFAVLFAYAVLAAVLGVALGNFARTPAQGIGIGVLAGNVLAALGGCWWPIEITPVWSQKLALFLPTGWAMDALHKLISFGEPASAILPHIAALAGSAALVGVVVMRKFRFY